MRVNNIVLFENKSDCCGCGACSVLCPSNAIAIKKDAWGFAYPVINTETCVNCGKCLRSCSYKNYHHGNSQEKEVYAAFSKTTDTNISSSGGVFASIALRFLKEGGLVAGAELSIQDNYWIPRITVIEKPDDLHLITGSKYVQCDDDFSFYSVIEEYLKTGKKVLFSGTPCQIDAMKNILKKYEDQMLFIDIVCHGTPSSALFNAWLENLSIEKNAEVTDFIFRDKKRYGWKLTGTVEYCRNESKFQKKIEGNIASYYRLFLDGKTYRDSCYHCKYAGPERVGDLTLGDFWGVQDEHPDFPVFQGVSCLIANTDKGKRWIKEHSDDFTLEQTSFEKVSKHNAQLLHPVSEPSDRKEIFDIFQKGGYECVELWYLKQYWLSIAKARFKNAIPENLKSAIKHLLRNLL